MLFVVALGLFHISCTTLAADHPAASQAQENSLAAIQKSGVLRAGVAINAPWVFRDSSGQWSGLEIDLLRQLAQDMNWKLEFVPTTWEHAIDDLRAHRFDLLSSGLSITPQRALLLKFSHPYGDYALGMVVNRQAIGMDDATKLQSGSSHTIGVLSGTVTAATTKDYFGQSKIVEVQDEAQAIKDLRNGKLDGFMAEEPVPTALAKTYANQLRTLDVQTYGRTAHGFAVRRSDDDLLDVINAWLIYQQASGWIRSREDFWIHHAVWVQLMQ
ncbi:amino acid ABC transporter substrate-binding protein [Dyella nitratireducens]|uniref:Amino acid ABC transporter substrate-binding protein n=2 Tax=Dyella nitratireducens TaxID=1849580 RepID=A0ABQ1G3M7_9GAMM|nr:amino acid ABC transporter substrate-binding protein [Dyella nitratireducens]GLQ41033.1 amino acid ABC transporter substrate-binding protein [Dyella nitratireducens]